MWTSSISSGTPFSSAAGASKPPCAAMTSSTQVFSPCIMVIGILDIKAQQKILLIKDKAHSTEHFLSKNRQDLCNMKFLNKRKLPTAEKKLLYVHAWVPVVVFYPAFFLSFINYSCTESRKSHNFQMGLNIYK